MDQKTMLINAVHPEEVRIAIVQDKELIEFQTESNLVKNLKGNVYKAKVVRIEPSLQAAFIDIGAERNGFLQINDVHPSYYRDNKYHGKYSGRIPIEKVLSEGQELVVQVVKEERDLKGATLTTFLTLPGRYVVLMPGSERGGISRKINDSNQRHRLGKLTEELEVPAGVGMIIRTAGLDRSLSELSRDLSLQMKLWQQILERSQKADCPTLLYEENDIITRVIRDYFTPEIREILVDKEGAFKRVKAFIEQAMPRYRSRVKLFQQEQPLFSFYNIDNQVGDTTSPEVALKSGGAIVIDPLEALVAIDVNSGKATGGGSIEDTAFRTNMEAAEEIARQLRLRDIGGLIVIDFIDMVQRNHKISVEKHMNDLLSYDKARIELGSISKFGLMEMSRQRLRASLASQNTVKCSACQGRGRVKTAELMALETLRKVQSAVVVGQVKSVRARLSIGPAFFLLNNKKHDLAELEKEYSCSIQILPDSRLRPDQVEFEMETSSPSEEEQEPTPETKQSSKKTTKPKRKQRTKRASTKKTEKSEDVAVDSPDDDAESAQEETDGETSGTRAR